jgi:hypothetical protein
MANQILSSESSFFICFLVVPMLLFSQDKAEKNLDINSWLQQSDTTAKNSKLPLWINTVLFR